MFGAEPSPVTGVDNSSGRIQSIANRWIKMDRAAIAGTFPFGLIARKACKGSSLCFHRHTIPQGRAASSGKNTTFAGFGVG